MKSKSNIWATVMVTFIVYCGSIFNSIETDVHQLPWFRYRINLIVLSRKIKYAPWQYERRETYQRENWILSYSSYIFIFSALGRNLQLEFTVIRRRVNMYIEFLIQHLWSFYLKRRRIVEISYRPFCLVLRNCKNGSQNLEYSEYKYKFIWLYTSCMFKYLEAIPTSCQWSCSYLKLWSGP